MALPQDEFDGEAYFTCCLDNLKSCCSRVCAGCGEQTPEKLKACTGCRASVYCSTFCQKADWPEHRHFCALQQNMLDFAYAAIFQPLRAAPRDRSLYPHTGRNCAVAQLTLKPPADEIATRTAGEYPRLLLANIDFLNERVEGELGEAIVLALRDGSMRILRLQPVRHEVRDLWDPLSHLEREFPITLLVESVLAETLGLKPGPWSGASSLRERIVQEPWAAFPGLQRKEAVMSVDKLRNDHQLNRGLIVYRKLNEAEVVDERSRRLAETILPIAMQDSQTGSKYSFSRTGSENSGAKGDTAPIESRIFALLGDRIVSLFFWVSDESAESTIGLAPGKHVNLVDLNTTTGICRILSSQGWHLYQLDDAACDRIAKAYGTEIANTGGGAKWSAWKDRLWPEESAGLFRKIKSCVETEDSKAWLLARNTNPLASRLGFGPVV